MQRRMRVSVCAPRSCMSHLQHHPCTRVTDGTRRIRYTKTQDNQKVLCRLQSKEPTVKQPSTAIRTTLNPTAGRCSRHSGGLHSSPSKLCREMFVGPSHATFQVPRSSRERARLVAELEIRDAKSRDVLYDVGAALSHPLSSASATAGGRCRCFTTLQLLAEGSSTSFCAEKNDALGGVARLQLGHAFDRKAWTASIGKDIV